MAIELKFTTGVLLVLQNLVENHDLFEPIGREIEETDEILREFERGLELKTRILWVIRLLNTRADEQDIGVC